MPAVDRETSRDRDLVLKHQHSASEISNRRMVPMWDSSDPDRAPPPLPLNPGAASPVTTRTGTSAAIAETAKLLSDKAKESILPGDLITTGKHDDRASDRSPEKSPEKSPERSLVRGAQHRRLQSLQTTSVKDLRSYLDGSKSPERQLGKVSTTSFEPVSLPASPEKSNSRASTPTPSARRPPPTAILGENTPPSATMLALQTWSKRDFSDAEPLSNITNSFTSSSVRSPPLASSSTDITPHIISLTKIANELREEMKTLTRRSKDNAKDLIELRGVTNSRDEDIRKALREMLAKLNVDKNERPPSTFGIPFLDGVDTTPKKSKSTTLTRFNSSPNFLGEITRSESPNLGIDGAASVAMLEKIIKEMSTKEGQENLLSKLEEIHKRSEADSGTTAQKVTELLEFVKHSGSQALVTRRGTNGSPPQIGVLPFDSSAMPTPLTVSREVGSKPYSSPRAADFVTNDVIKLLKKILDSVVQSGQMVGETRTQQKELRGEVLHMGRDLGRKLEETFRKPASGTRAIEDVDSKQNVARIVQQELAALKTYLDDKMRDHRRQSSSTVSSKASVDPREVYNMVKSALAEHGTSLDSHANALVQVAPVDKESILDAVKRACEEYQPDVHIEQIGLERDEILHCLREGLDSYRSDHSGPNVDREDIMLAVQDAMRNFQPPAPINELHDLREEIVQAFRESLDQLRPDINGTQLSTRELDITRNTLIDVVRDTLKQHGPNGAMALEISREDLFDAVRVGLESSGTPFGQYGERVVTLIHELVGDMRNEFKSYSAANGRDTEQVLDALKDGLESLRAEIETYVDRSQDVTGKSEIIDTVRSGIDGLRMDMENVGMNAPGSERGLSNEGDKHHLLNALHAGFESLRINGGMGGENGDMNESMKEEFEQLKGAVLGGTAMHRDDILETLREGFGSIQMRLDTTGPPSGSDLSWLKEELYNMRSSIGPSTYSGGSPDTDAVINAVRDAVESLRSQLSVHSGSTGGEVVEIVQEEIRGLREVLQDTLATRSGDFDHEVVSRTLQTGLDDIRATANTRDLGEALEGEFEKIRQTVAAGMSVNSGQAANDNIDTLRGELDDMRAQIIRNLDNPERQQKATSEFLDALNDGLEVLKGDVARMVDKPVDMTVNYEILDTLKTGISDLRADLDKIKGRASKHDAARGGNEIILAEASEASFAREVGPVQADLSDILKRDDMKEVEVMLTQLQIKVEALSATVMNPPVSASSIPTEAAPGTAMKEDLSQIETMLRDLQVSIESGSPENPTGLATKADTDALENYLANIRAKLENLPDVDEDQTSVKETVVAIENITRLMQDDLTSLNEHVKVQMPTQTDFGCIEVLAGDIKGIVERIRESQKEIETSEDSVKRHHIDTVGHALMEIKNKIDEMRVPDPDTLPEKQDVEQLHGLVTEFRESHDRLKETYESDVATTAKMFDERKREAEEIQGAVLRVRDFLDDLRDELRSKVDASNGGIAEVQDNVRGLEATVIAGFGMSDDVRALMTTLEREFEKAHVALQLLKEHHAEKSDDIVEKSEEHKTAVVSELTAKFDEHFTNLMSSYDDTKVQMELQSKGIEEQTAEQTVLLSSAKDMSEELKLTIDTFGTAITNMQVSLDDARERLNDESNFKTLYGKIDDTCARMDETVSENRAEGQVTREALRDEIAKSTAAISALQSEVVEYHPQFMVALRELQALVGQHYEQSQKAHDSAQEAARLASEEQKSAAEELKSQFSALPALMPATQLLPGTERDGATIERYDDAVLQDKLDKLMEIATAPTLSEVQLDRLDEIHRQVQTTAAELSAFVTSQTRLLTQTEEDRGEDATNARILLDRRQMEKEQLDTEIQAMATEKASLTEELETLRGDRDALIGQKNRLGADVSSIETALQIRREELHEMDAKADALERRILQGIMDQSRALLLTRSMKAATLQNSRKAATPQRMASNASHSTIASLPGPLDPAKQALALALRARPGVKRTSQPAMGPQDVKATRRIVSLSQISGNAPATTKAYLTPGSVPVNGQPRGLGGVRRAHSVKDPKPREASWTVDKTPKSRVVSVAEADEDKENGTEAGTLTLAEPTQVVEVAARGARDSLASDYSNGSEGNASTSDATEDRRSSQGTVVTHSAPSELRTESEVDTLPASSVMGALTSPDDDISEEEDEGNGEESSSDDDEGTDGGQEEPDQTDNANPGRTTAQIWGEEDVDDDVPALTASETYTDSHIAETATHVEEHPSAYPTKDFVVFNTPAPSDSGLGSDLPTAALMSGSETDYFRRRMEDVGSELSSVME